MARPTRIFPSNVISEYIDIDIENTANGDDEEWMKWVNKKFQKFAEDGKLSTENFQKALGLKKSFFAERFFVLFDTDRKGEIGYTELVNGLRMLKNETSTEKLQFLFNVFDSNGSGLIDKLELREVLKSCMEESSLTLCREDVDDLTNILFEEADSDHSGGIAFNEFQSALEKHPGLIGDLTFSATHWFELPDSRSPSRCSRYCSIVYCKHNTPKIVFILLYIIANLGLGGYAAWNHHHSNGCLIAARIGGMNLNFNCSLVLVLMLRHTLNLARSTRLGRYLPLDEHVIFHKCVGMMIVFWTLVHVVGHIGNAILVSENTENMQMWKVLFTDILNLGLFSGVAFITGWIILFLLIVMVFFSLPCVRSRVYQAFYSVHFLCVPFWILLICHCQHFWMWFILPGTIFIAEQIYRLKWVKQLRYGVTHIEQVTLLPCGVTHLEISRPKSFDFEPGDYMYLQIPDISPYEFHPFTISSAPELKDRLWLHIRTTGNWTSDLHKYLLNYDPGEDSEILEPITPMTTTLQKKRKMLRPASRRKSVIERLNGLMSSFKRQDTIEEINTEELARQKRIQQRTKSTHIRCFLDGPFGTASREALNTEHAILIGAGIGVTPMASILHSILHRIRKRKRKCPKCTHCWYDEMEENYLTMKKIDFVWINRDQRCFEWFVHLLNNLEIEQSLHSSDKLVDLHLYMTSAAKKTHMEGVGLQLALDLVHSKEQKDFFTGLKTKTRPGRPDWDSLFAEIAQQKKGKKKVFFCGPNPMADIIKKTCEKYSFAFAKEIF